MDSANKWFPFGLLPESGKPARVFCFHYAGGSSGVFKQWVSASDLSVEFIPIELPGRGTRISEPCLERMDRLMDLMVGRLASVLDERPFSFFGHSMGAIIAFEGAHRLQRKYGVQPSKLIVAGRHAPQCPDPTEFKIHMGDEALVQELKRLGGTPTEIIENAEILQFVLPMIRSDYRLHESYAYGGEKLNIPIIAHAGSRDIEANPSIMKLWSEVTDGEFELKEFDGDHFFVQRLGYSYLAEVARTAAS